MYFYFQPSRWKTVEFSRSQIIKAGKTIKDPFLADDKFHEAMSVIDNWRAAHAYPLHIIYSHLRRMAQGKSGVVVAQRLKRLDSIVHKLRREPTMSLWTMQDLGGCRFIVPALRDVYRYSEEYEHSRKRHILRARYDYIANPKPSGYRSLHVVYEYHSDVNETYNKNMLVEIQFRTHLQHLWATAVETMGLSTKQAIKSGQGSEEVKRFFALVSSLFAIREGQPVTPGTSDDVEELIAEIKGINDRCKFIELLRAIRVAVDVHAEQKSSHGYYILILNYETHRLRIKHFKPSQIEQANEIYNQIEKERAESKIDAVLVQVSSFSALKKAYPNYFSDIGEFVDLLQTYIST